MKLPYRICLTQKSVESIQMANSSDEDHVNFILKFLEIKNGQYLHFRFFYV